MTCSWPGCPKPRGGKHRLCWMHVRRKMLDRDMDAPANDPRSPFTRLKQAAVRLVLAETSGWSDRARLSAEEQLKRAAIGYRRSFKHARRREAA